MFTSAAPVGRRGCAHPGKMKGARGETNMFILLFDLCSLLARSDMQLGVAASHAREESYTTGCLFSCQCSMVSSVFKRKSTAAFSRVQTEEKGGSSLESLYTAPQAALWHDTE